jgi:branched-chain amino acid transport system permease protein
MVGLHTVSGPDGLSVAWRGAPVFWLVALVVAARMAGSLRWPADWRVRGRGSQWLAPALLVGAVTLPFWGSRYTIDTGTLVLIYIMLGWGLNIVVGLAGLLDLGYVAFYAVGAYTYAILSTRFGLGFWTCLPICGVFAATWGILLGFPVLRLRGDYLAIVTLGFGEIIRIVLNNWVSLTNGPQGIAEIPRPTLFGLTMNGSGPGSLAHLFGVHATPLWRVIFLYYLIFGLAMATNFVTIRLRRLPIGRAWEALREDEIACRALGIDVTRTKLAAFAIGACLAGFAGCFFAARAAFVSPESFVFMESATVLAIIVLGGLGSQLGTALAAVIMIGGGEFLRELLLDLAQNPAMAWAGSAASGVGQYRMLVFGLAMVAMMVLRPLGLIGRREPSVRLGKAPG